MNYAFWPAFNHFICYIYMYLAVPLSVNCLVCTANVVPIAACINKPSGFIKGVLTSPLLNLYHNFVYKRARPVWKRGEGVSTDEHATPSHSPSPLFEVPYFPGLKTDWWLHHFASKLPLLYKERPPLPLSPRMVFDVKVHIFSKRTTHRKSCVRSLWGGEGFGRMASTLSPLACHSPGRSILNSVRSCIAWGDHVTLLTSM